MKTSRLPYLFAGLAVTTIVTIAWITRGHFTPVVVGNLAPAFMANNMQGEPVRLSDYEGKVVLVNIWATWCAPCRHEMPSMERLYQELADEEDFEILAVSVDARFGERDSGGRLGGDIMELADSMGLTFPILHDPSGDIQQTFLTTGVPETFLIGKDGIIYKKVTGGTLWDSPEHVELVQRLLGG